MSYVWRWRTTKYGPLNAALQGRFGHSCRVICRGRNGSLLVEFEDGYRVVAMRYAVAIQPTAT